jgi:hypothetical protein
VEKRAKRALARIQIACYAINFIANDRKDRFQIDRDDAAWKLTPR